MKKRDQNQDQKKSQQPAKSGAPNIRLVAGAAGLLLFILGVRRTIQSDTAVETSAPIDSVSEPDAGETDLGASA